MVTRRATNGVPLRPKKNGSCLKGSPVASPRGSAHGTPNNSPRNSIYRETLKGNADKRAVSSSNVSRLATTSKGSRTPYASPNPPRSRMKTNEPASKRVPKDAGSPPRPIPPPKPSSLSYKSPSKTNSSSSPSATTGKKSKIPTSPPSSATKGNSSANTSSHSSAKLKHNHSNPSNNLSATSSSLSHSRQTSNSSNSSSKSTLSAPSPPSSNSSPNSHAVSNAPSSPRIARKPNLSSSTSATTKSGQSAAASTHSRNSQQQQHQRPHHRPGHIPSYLSKSTLSASTGKLNNGALIRGGAASASAGGNRSRPVSRELDSLNGKKSGSGSGCGGGGGGNRETVWGASNGGFSRPLAPTAKFRSDGEISICAADSPAVEKQATQPRQKYHSGQESGKRASDRGATIKKESNKTAAATGAAAASHSAKNLPTASVDSSRAAAAEASVARSSSVVSTERRAAAAAATRSRVAAQSTSNKSASLGAEKKEVGGEDEEEEDTSLRQNAFSRARSRSLTLFQRIGGALGRRNSGRTKNATHPHSLKNDSKSSIVVGHQRHEDWVFFRGFSGKRREDVIHDASSVASVAPAVDPTDHRLLALTSISSAPPPHRQRSRTRARRRAELRRTLSLTDAHFIAQAVCEGDTDLIQHLYPDFPRSEPIYRICDPEKRPRPRKLRPTSQHPVKGDEYAMSGEKWSPPFVGKVSRSGGSGMSANQRTAAPSSSMAGAGADGVAAPAPVFQPRKSNGTGAAPASAPHSSWKQQRGVNRQQPPTTTSQQQWNVPPPPPSVIGAHSVGSGHAHKNNEDFAGGPISHDGVTFSSSVMFVKQQDSHHHHPHAVVTDPGQASSMGE